MGSLEGTRALPPEWMDWVKKNLEMGVAGEVRGLPSTCEDSRGKTRVNVLFWLVVVGWLLCWLGRCSWTFSSSMGLRHTSTRAWLKCWRVHKRLVAASALRGLCFGSSTGIGRWGGGVGGGGVGGGGGGGGGGVVASCPCCARPHVSLSVHLGVLLVLCPQDHRPSKEDRVAKKRREWEEAHREPPLKEEFVCVLSLLRASASLPHPHSCARLCWVVIVVATCVCVLFGCFLLYADVGQLRRRGFARV